VKESKLLKLFYGLPTFNIINTVVEKLKVLTPLAPKLATGQSCTLYSEKSAVKLKVREWLIGSATNLMSFLNI
jgi:hypothetical protein